MVTLADLFQNTDLLNISERTLNNAPQIASQVIPESGLLMSYMKKFENTLTHRGLLPALHTNTFNPIWFLAEMEQNIYLWRKGLSIDNLNDYYFWLDPKILISKRLTQLENKDITNPFLNPLWGSGTTNDEITGQEQRYLERFLELYKHAEIHLGAISLIQLLLTAVDNTDSVFRLNKPLVILPAYFKQH